MKTYNEIEFLNWVGRLLGNLSLFSKQEGIIREILKSVPEISGADYSSFLILKENPEKIAYDYYPEKKEFSTHRSTANLAIGIEGEVIRKRNIIVTRNSYEFSNRKSGIMDRIKLLIAAPIGLRGEVEGILYLYYFEDVSDKVEEIKELIRNIAPILAYALANSRLYQKLNEVMRELRISCDLSNIINASLDIDQLIEEIIKQLTMHFGYEIIAVYLVEEDGKYATLKWGVNSIKEHIGTKMRIDEGGIIGRVIETGQPYYAADVSMVPLHGPKGFKKRSEFSIPLKIRDKVIGVLDIESLQREAFPKSARNLLVALGAQIAIAIERSKLFEETKRLSIEDPLTGAVNRRILEEKIMEEIALAEKRGEEFTILFLDFDNFKEFNDRYGHQRGDEGLKIFSNIMKSCLSSNDLLGRYGGDEFIALLRKTNINKAVKIANQMLEKVRENEFLKGLTVSIGVGVYPYDGKTFIELVRYADNACYIAKEKGGDRIEFSSIGK
ncbi:MAG: diguanylate cyclase [candidate division WOR-3 bacterium]